MNMDERTRSHLDQTIRACLSLFFVDPLLSESERESAEIEGRTHLEHIAREITGVLLRDFRIDPHLDRSHVEASLERCVYDVLFDGLVGWPVDGGARETGQDVLDFLHKEIVRTLVTEHRIQVLKE